MSMKKSKRKSMTCAIGAAAFLAAAMTAAAADSSAGSGHQIARAVLDQDGESLIVTVDLTDGWSVEFSRGALYLYEGGNDDSQSADVLGVTLDREVYDEYVAAAESSDSCRELEDGLFYEDGSSNYYLISIDDDAFFLLDAADQETGDEAYSRISFLLENEAFRPAAEYEGTWVSDRAELTIDELEDAILCTIHWGSSAQEATEWSYECMYDEVTGGLTTLETGVKAVVTYDEDGEIVSTEEVYNDGAANFVLDGEDKLVWTDFKETPGENEIVFERVPDGQ